MGNAALVNDADFPPPADGTFPEAGWLNQCQRQPVALGRVVPSVRMTIDFTAGDPGIVALMSGSTLLTPPDFTLTDEGDGITLIAWDAGAIPPMTCDPNLTVNADSDTTGVALVVSATSVRVKTRTGGALADARFTVSIN